MAAEDNTELYCEILELISFFPGNLLLTSTSASPWDNWLTAGRH